MPPYISFQVLNVGTPSYSFRSFNINSKIESVTHFLSISKEPGASLGIDRLIEMSTTSAVASSFLDLPPEIRVEIYRHLLCYVGQIHAIRAMLIRSKVANPTYNAISDESSNHHRKVKAVLRPTSLKASLHPAILLTNKKMYSEARHVLYRENIFAFGFGNLLWAAAVIPFLEGISSESRRLIRYVSLRVGSENGRDLGNLSKALETSREIYSYIKQNLKLEIFRLGGTGIDETTTQRSGC